MTLKTARLQRQIRPDRRAQLHVPHSSWSRSTNAGRDAPLPPEEFWSRLGL